MPEVVQQRNRYKKRNPGPRPSGEHARVVHAKVRRLPVIEQYWRPTTRSDCYRVPRPCPYVGCRYSLYLEVTVAGGIKFTFPGLEPADMRYSCALDVAERGPSTLEEVGEMLNVVRERVRQLQERARRKLAAAEWAEGEL